MHAIHPSTHVHTVTTTTTTLAGWATVRPHTCQGSEQQLLGTAQGASGQGPTATGRNKRRRTHRHEESFKEYYEYYERLGAYGPEAQKEWQQGQEVEEGQQQQTSAAGRGQGLPCQQPQQDATGWKAALADGSAFEVPVSADVQQEPDADQEAGTVSPADPLRLAILKDMHSKGSVLCVCARVCVYAHVLHACCTPQYGR